MLGVKAVAEGMGDLFVLHHTTMPGVGKTAHAVHAARCLENGLHVAHHDNPSEPVQDAEPGGFRAELGAGTVCRA